MMRFLNTGLSVWLLLSAFLLPTLSWGTGANSGLVALSVFLLSFVGSYPRRVSPPAPRT